MQNYALSLLLARPTAKNIAFFFSLSTVSARPNSPPHANTLYINSIRLLPPSPPISHDSSHFQPNFRRTSSSPCHTRQTQARPVTEMTHGSRFRHRIIYSSSFLQHNLETASDDKPLAKSTFPGTPATTPLSVYCQINALLNQPKIIGSQYSLYRPM